MMPVIQPTPDQSGTHLPTNGWHRRRNWLTSGLLLVLAWMLYLPSTRYGFVDYDDVRILKDHPELYGQPGLAADLKAIFVTSFPREEPLLVRDVSWAVDSRIFGFGNAVGYHLGNVLLHGVVVALVFAVLLGSTRRYDFALATAAAYLVLAVHVEPVAWIMGRKDILSALFMLLALGTQTKRLAAGKFGVQCAWYAATLSFFALALLSKISVLTFPLVLFLHAILLPYLNRERPPATRFPWDWTVARELGLLLPSLCFSGVVYLWYQRTLDQAGVFDRGYTAHGLAHLWNLLIVNPCGFWLYLRQIFLPFHSCLFYAWPQIEPSFPFWQKMVALATLAGSLGAGLWLFRRQKDLFFYYAAFFVLMIPYLNLIFIGIWVADRYLYFSVVCVLAIAISAAEWAWKHSTRVLRWALVLAGVAWLADNGYEAISYLPVWRNAESLWQYHVALPGHPPAAYNNLAAAYYAEFGEAVARQDTLRAATALRKMKTVVEAGLAEYWPDQKQPPPPQTYFLFFLRSLIEEVNGDPDAALASLLMADRLHPGFDSTNLNLSRLYRRLAATTKDAQQRAIYLQAAHDRLATYIALVFRGRSPPPEVRQEMADLETACSALAQPAARTTKSSP